MDIIQSLYNGVLAGDQRSILMVAGIAVVAYLLFRYTTKSQDAVVGQAMSGNAPVTTAVPIEGAVTVSTLAPQLSDKVATTTLVGPVPTATDVKGIPVNGPAAVVPVINSDSKVVSVPVLTTMPWRCVQDVTTPVRRNANQDVECMTLDGANCQFHASSVECAATAANPPTTAKGLACGEDHKALYGVTGYDDPLHWCAIASKAMA